LHIQCINLEVYPAYYTYLLCRLLKLTIGISHSDFVLPLYFSDGAPLSYIRSLANAGLLQLEFIVDKAAGFDSSRKTCLRVTSKNSPRKSVYPVRNILILLLRACIRSPFISAMDFTAVLHHTFEHLRFDYPFLIISSCLYFSRQSHNVSRPGDNAQAFRAAACCGCSFADMLWLGGLTACPDILSGDALTEYAIRWE